MKNPYLTESIDVMQSLFEEDEDDSNRTLPNQVVKVKVERKDDEEAYMPTSCASASSSHQVLSAPPKKRKVTTNEIIFSCYHKHSMYACSL